MCHDTLQHSHWTRRGFLKGAGMAFIGLGLGGIPPFVVQAATQKRTALSLSKNKVLVTIFQRGAMDGLAAVQPIDNTFLQSVRPNLFLGTQGEEALLPLNDDFGLSPYLSPLKKYFDDGQMAIIHGVGLPLDNRSHFDMQDFLESGTPGKKSTRSGWLNRSMNASEERTVASPFRAVAMTPTRPRIFYGDRSTIAIERLEDLDFKEEIIPEEALNGIGQAYAKEQNERLRNAGVNGLEAIKLMKHIDMGRKTAHPYPNSPLGESLRQISQLIKAEVGLEIAFAESTGWDTHSRQPTKNGAFARNAKALSTALAAFWEDLGKYQDEVLVMTMTEFGRTTKQNGALGTDHGRGSCQFILGNSLREQLVHHDLKRIDAQTCGRELPVTTDFRDVFATVLKSHLNLANADIFPNHKTKPIALFG